MLAGNIANLDTPGYKTRDLSPELFQAKAARGGRGQSHAAAVARLRLRQLRLLGTYGTIQNIDATASVSQMSTATSPPSTR